MDYPDLSTKETEVDEDGFCAKLTEELSQLKFIEKNNDLYQFHQVSKPRSRGKITHFALNSGLITIHV